MHEQDLQGIVDALRDMTARFEEPTTAAAPHLSSTDRAAFKRLMLEAKSMLDSDLGPLNDFSTPLVMMTKLPGYGAFNPPSLEELQEAIGIVEGGLNHARRKQNRQSSPLGVPLKPPYVNRAVSPNYRTLLSPHGTRADWSACCRS